MSVRILELETADDATIREILERRTVSDPSATEVCREIIETVRLGGDAALVAFTQRFDRADISVDGPRVPAAAIEQAEQRLDPVVREALDDAMRNIARFHQLQLPPPFEFQEMSPGVACGERWTPIDSVCLYVPRGRGSFSSVACMLAVPARLAGVGRITLLTPPAPDGSVDAATLYVARKTGIDEVFRVGGAQGIAAVAFGTESVPRSDKVIGPGNVHVNTARDLLAGILDPGPPAGPSESLLLADRSAPTENIAWNLLIEAEHGENSCALLLTDDPRLAIEVAAAVERLLDRLTPERRAFATEVLNRRGGILVTSGLDASIEFANRFAAEHVALMVADPDAVWPRIRNAGEILIGDYPIFSLANYAMGINAVLPTGGRARTRSGVSIRDFFKTTSVGRVSGEGFEALRKVVVPLSRDEGFSAHHEAVLAWQDPALEVEASR